MRNASSGDFVLVYDFTIEDALVAQMQKVSLDTSPHGLSPSPLIGSKEWWDEIGSDRRPVQWVEGAVDRVWWGSMADYPEFSIRAEDGTVTTWTRQGAGRRYVEGIRVRLGYVEHPWKDLRETERLGLKEMSSIVLQIWIEDTPRRSSGIAPGPGGAGYQVARQHRTVVHYLEFSSRELAARAVVSLERDGTEQSRPYRGGTRDSWFVDVGDADISAVDDRRRELATVAQALGGRYDGGEIVEGAIWGPNGNVVR